MESHRIVRPVPPAAAYIGGKRLLAKTIVPLLEEIPHATYAEPFVGMGGVFLRRTRVPRAEVINDVSRDVWTFFRILQVHYTPFLDMLRYQLTTRAEFERLMDVDPSTLTDLQRAARFLYLQRTAFGGKVAGRNFGVDPASPGRFDVTRLVPVLEAIHERLAGVVIERLPYADFVARYDRPETLFYLDPPYWGSEADYGAGVFGREDFARLAELLAGIRGRFVLSINDTPGARDVFGRFELREVATRYGIGTGQKPARELLVLGGGR